MKITHLLTAAALVLTPVAAAHAQAAAQTTTTTSTSTDDNGVTTKKTKVETVHKHKTRHAKRILGVKVGHKTRVHKTVKESSVSSNGDHSTTVKTTNK